MVVIDNVVVKPNPVDAGKTFEIEITLHEVYESAKRYPNTYPHRYGEPKGGKK